MQEQLSHRCAEQRHDIVHAEKSLACTTAQKDELHHKYTAATREIEDLVRVDAMECCRTIKYN